MVSGFAAILMPHVAAIAINILLGALLILDGVFQGIHAFHLRGFKGCLWRVLGSLLSVFVGVLLLLFPLTGAVSLTLVMAFFLLVGGVFKLMLSFQFRSVSGWGWLLFSGILSFVLAGMILLLWPEAALWVLGTLVGVDLVFGGWWMIIIGYQARRQQKQPAPSE